MYSVLLYTNEVKHSMNRSYGDHTPAVLCICLMMNNAYLYGLSLLCWYNFPCKDGFALGYCLLNGS